MVTGHCERAGERDRMNEWMVTGHCERAGECDRMNGWSLITVKELGSVTE